MSRDSVRVCHEVGRVKISRPGGLGRVLSKCREGLSRLDFSRGRKGRGTSTALSSLRVLGVRLYSSGGVL